ncbi:MAG: hypothetical protein Q4C77_03820 [Eubacteriales bacterium]|nr:hypothetical protein [Eubacteriales bacterium]
MNGESRTIKTIKGWEMWTDSQEPPCNTGWDQYCKPGELVDEGVYDYFLDILPPRSMGYGYLQVGEPHDHRLNPKTGKYAATYATFVRVEKGIYRYCGNCFAGQTEHIA